jgi:hypothetical protein
LRKTTHPKIYNDIRKIPSFNTKNPTNLMLASYVLYEAGLSK